MKGTLSCFLDHLHSQFLIPRSYLREFKNQLDVFPKTSDIEEQLLCKLSTFLSALSPAEWYQALLKNYLNFKSQQPQQQQQSAPTSTSQQPSSSSSSSAALIAYQKQRNIEIKRKLLLNDGLNKLTRVCRRFQLFSAFNNIKKASFSHKNQFTSSYKTSQQALGYLPHSTSSSILRDPNSHPLSATNQSSTKSIDDRNTSTTAATTFKGYFRSPNAPVKVTKDFRNADKENHNNNPHSPFRVSNAPSPNHRSSDRLQSSKLYDTSFKRTRDIANSNSSSSICTTPRNIGIPHGHIHKDEAYNIMSQQPHLKSSRNASSYASSSSSSSALNIAESYKSPLSHRNNNSNSSLSNITNTNSTQNQSNHPSSKCSPSRHSIKHLKDNLNTDLLQKDQEIQRNTYTATEMLLTRVNSKEAFKIIQDKLTNNLITRQEAALLIESLSKKQDKQNCTFQPEISTGNEFYTACKRRDNPSPFERLYRDGVEHQTNKSQILKDIKNYLDLKECTFQPQQLLRAQRNDNTSTTPSNKGKQSKHSSDGGMIHPTSPLERWQQSLEKIKAKVDSSQQQHQSEISKQHNSTTPLKKPASSPSAQQNQLFSRLYSEAERKKKQAEMNDDLRKQRELAECSFKPILNATITPNHKKQNKLQEQYVQQQQQQQQQRQQSPLRQYPKVVDGCSNSDQEDDFETLSRNQSPNNNRQLRGMLNYHLAETLQPALNKNKTVAKTVSGAAGIGSGTLHKVKSVSFMEPTVYEY